MIFGHGIDLQEISAVKKAYDRNPRFAKKVLTPKEWERFESLSGGQRQRAWIAMVLAQETAIMLLDEPTTWLDISHQIDLLELLSELNREKGYTLAAVLHDLNQACRYASHLIALREGKIVAQGAPKEIVTAELIERIYGLRCMIIDDPVAGTPLVVPLGRTAPSTANS